MQQSDKKRFKELVGAMAVNFRAEVSTPLYQAYWMGLSDIPLPDIEKAFKRAMRECEFMPPAARLRELAGRGRDVKAYHMPYKGLPSAEAKRIRESWKQLGPAEGISHIGELLETYITATENEHGRKS